MNGFIAKTVAAASMAFGLAGTGCCNYHDLVDPCYPQRYNFAARTEVCASLTPQVKNGHALEQTIWNWQFEPTTDRLNAAGLAALNEMVRRRPMPDPIVYLATAQAPEDITYAPGQPEAYAEARRDLDSRRIASVQRYLNAHAGDRGIAFQVAVHDPSDPSLPARGLAIAIAAYYAGFTGQGLSGGVGGAPGGGAGGGGGGGAAR